MRVTIRPFRATDAAAAIDLFRASVRELAARDYAPSQIRAWAPDAVDERAFGQGCERNGTWVAEIGDRIAGFSDLEPDGHIDMLYVHPDLSRRGVARALLQHIEHRARMMNLPRLHTEASLTARPVFEAVGFQVIAARTVTVRGESMTNFRMERQL